MTTKDQVAAIHEAATHLDDADLIKVVVAVTGADGQANARARHAKTAKAWRIVAEVFPPEAVFPHLPLRHYGEAADEILMREES